MVLSGRIIKGHKSVYHRSVTDTWTLNGNTHTPVSATEPSTVAAAAIAPAFEITAASTIAPANTSISMPDFHDRLENCLLSLCHDADIPAPIWLSKNTNDLARFKKTSFYAEQFAEKVNFDRFEIKITDL